MLPATDGRICDDGTRITAGQTGNSDVGLSWVSSSQRGERGERGERGHLTPSVALRHKLKQSGLVARDAGELCGADLGCFPKLLVRMQRVQQDICQLGR